MVEKEIFKLEGEIWRPVVGYEGLYEVSNLGRVASLNYMHTNKRHLLSPGNKNGYVRVMLFKNGKGKTKFVHRLVAEAFQDICGTYFEGAEVDHINTITYDNRASNLRWCTRKENNINPITIKRRSEANKGKHFNRPDKSKQVIQYTKDGQFVAEYQSIMEAERETGIANTHISSCCLGKGYKSAGGFIWEYAV